MLEQATRIERGDLHPDLRLETIKRELRADERRLLSTIQHLGLSFFWFALNFQFAALLPIVLPAQIVLFVAPGAVGNTSQATFLGVVAALGAVVALVVQPIVGLISDRTTSRLGRRRPFILSGGLLLVAGLGILATSPDRTLFLIGLAIVIIAHTASSAAYQGLVPDCVPEQQRGAASGYTGLMTLLGTVGSLAVAALLLGQATAGHAMLSGIALGASHFYLVAAGVLLVGVVVTMFGVREVPLARRHRGARAPREARSVGQRLGGLRTAAERLWIAPWRHANFAWVFLTRAFVMLGLALFMTFIEYYFSQVGHVASFVQATALIAVLSLAGAVCSTLVVGIFTDRMRRRVPVVLVASALMALTALAFVVAPGQLPLWPLGITFGLGYGAYTSVDWALAIDTLPQLSSAGKDMGLWSIASTLPGILAPVLGTVVLSAVTPLAGVALAYRLVFGLAAICLALGAVFVLKVREGERGNARAEGSDGASTVMDAGEALAEPELAAVS